jgi:hypothetical protein
MPRLNLNATQIQQLNDWLYGGPTDPIGIIPQLEANAAGTLDPPLSAEAVYQAEGERDFYLLLLAKDGKNIVRSDITPKMADALQWVAGSLDQWEALGIPIEDHQQMMRPLWNFIRQL